MKREKKSESTEYTRERENALMNKMKVGMVCNVSLLIMSALLIL